MEKRTLELTHKQIELITSALGIAEKTFTDLSNQYVKNINVRGSSLNQTDELFKIALSFADINCDIRQGNFDV